MLAPLLGILLLVLIAAWFIKRRQKKSGATAG